MSLRVPLFDFAPGVWPLTGLLLIAPPLLGADDNYLREIEEEAKRQATFLMAGPVQSSAATDSGTDRMAAGANQASFEKALRDSLPGTWAFYLRLSPAGKQQVYEAYQQDNRFSNISEQIIRLQPKDSP
ncbi:MAG TPA: hypothetical protein PKI41_09095 [Candidatus Competibacteraceae bacterium]|nr:MAG: hypothetical protein EKK71_04545 [Candidatus Competibacteraceae bacterium]HOB62266.1 hypothetical protein [Candidatus Competibacteraceae bacterium]HQA25552.1 hypothetical protein [Candidatus Competibacteraceae bacterium]HQD56536.1 hypothetical protein [Candidatus Competibacteraceae bacterium]